MKKIGIITIVKVGNYGAELQAFALQKKLELLGFEAEIIDYLYYKNWRFKDTEMSKPFVPMSFKDRLMYRVKYRIGGVMADCILPVFRKAVNTRASRFAEFHRRNTKFSREFRSMPALYAGNFEYDAYVVGSDQVWNPSAMSSIEPYFLTFAPKSARKLSYASSFGVAEIKPGLHERYKVLLDNIGAISVRESSGVSLVERLTGRKAQLVADPTLLLTRQEWSQYMQPYQRMPEHYVLIYSLSASDAVTRLALQIGRDKGIPVYRVCKRAFGMGKDAGVTNILDAGPAEFLSLIANADYAVTNSFHGTAFAVNFNVPFFTVVSSVRKNNSRMESLLATVGLKRRLLTDDADISGIDFDSPDFTVSNENLARLRQVSVEYIKNSLL